MKKRLLSLVALGLSIVSYGQISEGGLPTTFARVIQGGVSEFNTNYQIVELNSPNMQEVYAQDELIQEKHEGYRVGILEPVNLTIQNSGTWQVMPNGDKIWRLAIKMQGAVALGLYFDENVVIPEGGKLYAYNQNHSQYVGAYTSNTPSFRSMEMIEGELLTLEYFMPVASTVLPTIVIGDVSYFYRGIDSRMQAFRDGFSIEAQEKSHQSCEVNVACPEISGWESQRDAVVKYTFSSGGDTFLCTGSMINNTNNDCTPYFITANHCGEPTSSSNISQHTFYFNYQRPTCQPGQTASYSGAQSQTMSGGTLKASSQLGTQSLIGGITGSDFILIELSGNVPAAYNAYYEGWDRATNGSASGVGIHHPNGTDKMISTYSSTLSSATYNGGWASAHWEVEWASTASGHGVTEGGSSGSPIFNTAGLVVGHLSGGSSFCTDPTATDLYGKFIKAWDGEGNNANQQLKAWLDPTNTGSMSLSGTYAPCSPSAPIADFNASATSVTPSTTVTFTDLSTNAPTSWAWTVTPGAGWSYAGGTSATSQNPQITFNTLGLYTVSLIATNAVGGDTETKTDYINVTTVANPCVANSTQACASADEYISNVTLNTINNSTTCSNYTDYSAISTTLQQGVSYDVTVMPTTSGTAGSAYNDDEIAVWIDWNNDATFSAAEQVGYTIVETGWSNVMNFTVPANAAVGNLKMRVRISYQPDDGNIDPCGTTEWGETEDYTIVIDAPVIAAPVAQFVANQTTAPENTTISFTDQSTNIPTSWNWSVSPSTGWTYAGGTSAATQNPQINFTTAGVYSVTLTATNANGSDDEVKTNYITITSVATGSAPVAQFVADQTTVLQSTVVAFTDQSTNTPTSWSWIISPSTGWIYVNGLNSSSQNPDVMFTGMGTYTVTLTATNATGSDNETKTNYITVTQTESVEENELSNISIYPNPTNSVIYVNLINVNAVSVVITDVTGRVVSQNLNPNGIVEFELNEQSSGVYFVKINSENNSITKKVVRN